MEVGLLEKSKRLFIHIASMIYDLSKITTVVLLLFIV